MASGINHDKGIIYASPAYLLGFLLTVQDIQIAIYAVICFMLCGFYLSPDLDCYSRPYKRWGALRFIWLPYQRLIPHRGLSHWIIIGSLSRIAYLLAVLIPILLLGGILSSHISISTIISFIGGNTVIQKGFVWFLISCEASAFIHYFLDDLFGILPRQIYDRLK